MKLLRAIVSAAAFYLPATSAVGQEWAALPHPYPDNSIVDQSLQDFAKRVQSSTAGKVAINVIPQTRVSADVVTGLSSGSTGFALVPAPVLAAKLKQFAAFDIPYLLKSYEHADSIVDGAIGERLLKSLSEIGLGGLAFFDQGFTAIVSTSPIKSLADLKGKRVAVFGPPVRHDAMQLYGAIPARVPGSDIYAALSRGTVDGSEVSSQFALAQLKDKQWSVTYTQAYYRADVLVVSMRWLSKTNNAALIDALRAEAAKSARSYRAVRRKNEAVTFSKLRAEGSLHQVRQSEFAQSVATIYKNDFVADIIRAFTDICPTDGCPLPPICCTSKK